jgi:hypothetical protein
MPASPSNDALLLAALDLLQGMLLLHPPSRALFSRDTHMTVSPFTVNTRCQR